MRRTDARDRILVGSFALVIAVAGITVALVPLWPRGSNQSALRPREQPVYVVTFPPEPIPVDGQLGHYSIPVTTNLPAGTLVDLEYTDALGEGGGCCTQVISGVLQVPLVNNHCVDKNGTPEGSDVTVHVVAAPKFGFFGNQKSMNSRPQPDDVIAVLGPNFEDLNGPDVQIRGETRVLTASKEYQLPADTCVSPYSH